MVASELIMASLDLTMAALELATVPSLEDLSMEALELATVPSLKVEVDLTMEALELPMVEPREPKRERFNGGTMVERAESTSMSSHTVLSTMMEGAWPLGGLMAGLLCL